jgi:transposase-like protein
MSVVPKPFPKEFKEDVIRVARSREHGKTIEQVAKDFGISASCLTSWLSVADRGTGSNPG